MGESTTIKCFNYDDEHYICATVVKDETYCIWRDVVTVAARSHRYPKMTT